MSEYEKASAAGNMFGGIVANFGYENASAAADFYKKAFAAEELNRVAAPDGRLRTPGGRKGRAGAVSGL